jgi:transcriptional regulator with XRE-family HTH domain
MSGDRPAVNDLWDLTPSTILPRSRLYHLEPIGVGTPYVEGLTGYISRLAEAHSVPPRALIVRELGPLLRTARLSGPTIGGLSSFWWAEARTLNGTRTQAQDWVRALEALTLRNDLRFLTFLPWAEVLDQKQLLRRTRAWCPACYGEWRGARQVVYDPLLWAVAAVTACPRHRRRLRLQCEGCRRPLPTLASRSRSGHCPHCDRWLGTPPEGPLGLDDALEAAELACQMGVVDAIGAMIAAAPRLPAPPRRERVVQAITALVEQVGAGKLAALARRVSLPRDMVWRWHRGKAVPRLDSFLRLCLGLGTTPLCLLTGEGDIVDRNRRTSAPATLVQAQPPSPRKPPDAQRVRRALARVVDRRESPPPCMREVARRLGSESANLYHRFPELCRAISAQFQAHRKARSLERRQQLCDEVRKATFHLHSQGVYPSHDRVEALLSLKAALRLPYLKVARLAALRDLGLK